MREIKFRAWDKKENKMQQVVQILYGHEASNYPLSVDFFRSVKSRLIKDIELMQYTGLKDKNGKEIYEGDIVKVEWPKTTLYKKITADDDIVGQIDYEFGQFWCVKHNGYGGDGYPLERLFNYSRFTTMPSNIEVIGNIYESKHLLNK